MNQSIPTHAAGMQAYGWDRPDVLLLTGDAFVDHPAFGTAVIARVLEAAGYRVAVADSLNKDDDAYVRSFGTPRLFYGVTGGNVDSMVSRYTAFGKVRNDDPYRAGGSIKERPRRAVITYCNMLKQIDKDVPVVIGGLEASMRRFTHYDYTDNTLRRSILLDSRADILVYGMGEDAVQEIARRIDAQKPLHNIAGTVVLQHAPPAITHLLLADQEEEMSDQQVYAENFRTVYTHPDSCVVQRCTHRYLVQYPPSRMESESLDRIYALPFTRQPADKYASTDIPAYQMIRHSITAHRGCVSGCAFCSIALHQGRRIVSRSENSVLREAETISKTASFRGHITDVGGPSANMYGTVCRSNKDCHRESCLYPSVCAKLNCDTRRWLALLQKVRGLPGISLVTLGSGIRYDLLMYDAPEALEAVVRHHVGGQLKIAPEHTEPAVLDAMRKKPVFPLDAFVTAFRDLCVRHKKKYYIVPYLMSNHPGSTYGAMQALKKKMRTVFGSLPHQVQSFYPLPMTLSSVQYYTGYDPLTRTKVYVEQTMKEKRCQHSCLVHDKHTGMKQTKRCKH